MGLTYNGLVRSGLVRSGLVGQKCVSNFDKAYEKVTIEKLSCTLDDNIKVDTKGERRRSVFSIWLIQVRVQRKAL